MTDGASLPEAWRGSGKVATEAPRPDPTALACALHARFGIQSPSDIEVEPMAWHYGARVRWRDAGSADARVVRSGPRAILTIAKEARGTPRARFSIAHELGHLLMHADFDAIERIHGGARTERREFVVELEADRFASELLLPRLLAEARCASIVRPTITDVGELAREFRVSLTVAAKRWPAMTGAPCAFFEAKRTASGGVLRRAVRSKAFRGVAFERRALDERSVALEMLRAGSAAPALGTRVHDAAWGSAALGAPIVEECVPVADGVVVGWLGHERGARG